MDNTVQDIESEMRVFIPEKESKTGYRLTDADRKKGWEAHAQHPRGGFNPIMAITRRRWCSPNCIVFYQCPMMPVAMSAKPKEKACLINGYYDPQKKLFVKTGDKLRRRFINMFMTGEDGIIDEMKRVLFDYSIESGSATIQDRKDYIDMLLKLYRSLYGDRKAARVVEPITITLREIGFDGELIGEGETIHKSKHMNNVVNNHKVAQKMKENFAIRLAAAEDKESLATSPMLEGILNHEILPSVGIREESQGNVETGRPGQA